MIDFRYHVVSIVAVFLALALGLFIGSTSLRGPVANFINSRTDQVVGQNRQLRSEISSLQASVRDEQQFETATQPYITGNVLAGESVVVVSAPGTDGGTRTRLISALTAAGANVTGDVRLQDALLDPNQRTFLETLVARLGVPGHDVPPGTGAQRAMSLLAQVLGIRPQSTPVPPTATARVLAGFTDGNLVTVNGSVARSASLAVVLAPPPPSANADPKTVQSQDDLLLDLVRALDHSAVGAVLAGPLASADTGLLKAARADKLLTANVSTVDGVDLPRGIIATVLALAQQAKGGVGSYGTQSGASGPVPSPSPS
ncbi:MAG TPA: copper transporter [Mycobacteriales bacterium]|nr:copper transporter [Mycobacteriales bacterium]